MTITKRIAGFFREFADLVKATAMFCVLSSIIMAAVLSQGLWSKFFFETLPEYGLLCLLIFTAMALYHAYYRNQNGAYSGDGYDDEDYGVNPATGLPMVNDGVDAGGHVFGSDD